MLTVPGNNSLKKSFFSSQLIITLTLSNLVIFNWPLFSYAVRNLDVASVNGILTLVTLVAVISTFTVVILALLVIITPILLKPFCVLVVLLNSVALYFIVNYRVILDRTMMGNILNTRTEESIDFLHPTLFLYILFIGGVPAWLILKLKVPPTKRISLVAQTAVLLMFSLILIYVSSPTWLWFDKHAKAIGGRTLPWSYINNTIRSLSEQNRSNKKVIALPDATFVNDDKVVVVLIVGEAARAANFSVYGYERQTNPEIEKLDIAVLGGAKSCSTYTVASLRCMLSHKGNASTEYEPLPTYLQRSGVEVTWRTNNWGEPPITIGKYQNAGDLRKTCLGKYCQFDDVLLFDLDTEIDSGTREKQLITLHTKGSHGPAYHSRYPKQFDVFQPVCRSVELNQCSEQSLINAYDNTILYTDDFLKRTIDILEARADTPSVLLYVSDHGESLGEFGLYLHGTPYALAPDVQKEVPFIVWMSDAFKQKRALRTSDLLQSDSYSHSHVFHSILGALGLQSDIYNPVFDIFNVGDTLDL